MATTMASVMPPGVAPWATYSRAVVGQIPGLDAFGPLDEGIIVGHPPAGGGLQ
jgi:hypothetical protein